MGEFILDREKLSNMMILPLKKHLPKMTVNFTRNLLRFLVCSSSVVSLFLSQASARLGDDETEIVERYGTVLNRTKSPYGLPCTEHQYGGYKVLIAYRDGHAVAETFSLHTQPTDISDLAISSFLSLGEPGEKWTQQPNSDDCRQWSRPGARASYELETPEHLLKFSAVEGEGASTRFLSTPGAKPKPIKPLNLLKFKKDRFAGTEHISFQQPIRVTPGMTLDVSTDRLEGQKDFSNLSVSFYFIQTGEQRWKFDSSRTFFMLIDGARTSPYEPSYSGKVIGADTSIPFALEQMWVKVESSTFWKIAYATSVEARIGVYEFKISYAERAAMRQLADEMMKASTIVETALPQGSPSLKPEQHIGDREEAP